MLQSVQSAQLIFLKLKQEDLEIRQCLKRRQIIYFRAFDKFDDFQVIQTFCELLEIKVANVRGKGYPPQSFQLPQDIKVLKIIA